MAEYEVYTLAEAQEMLSIFKEAYKELASGQTKSYRIGTREWTGFDLDELMEYINYFARLIRRLSGQKSVKRVVFRDL